MADGMDNATRAVELDLDEACESAASAVSAAPARAAETAVLPRADNCNWSETNKWGWSACGSECGSPNHDDTGTFTIGVVAQGNPDLAYYDALADKIWIGHSKLYSITLKGYINSKIPDLDGIPGDMVEIQGTGHWIRDAYVRPFDFRSKPDLQVYEQTWDLSSAQSIACATLSIGEPEFYDYKWRYRLRRAQGDGTCQSGSWYSYNGWEDKTSAERATALAFYVNDQWIYIHREYSPISGNSLAMTKNPGNMAIGSSNDIDTHPDRRSLLVGMSNYLVDPSQGIQAYSSLAVGEGNAVGGTASIAMGTGCLANNNRAMAFGANAHADTPESFVWNGDYTSGYYDHGSGTFNINPAPVSPSTDPASGFYIRGKSLRGYLDETAAAAVSLESVTWSNLKTLRDNGNLVPGRQYRITDYIATSSNTSYPSANHPFDIIVTADSENKINEHARAIRHEGDSYFPVGTKFEAWDVWYCLDNDTARFNWADATANGRGVVYRLIDEFGNDLPFDFKGLLTGLRDSDKVPTFPHLTDQGDITDWSLTGRVRNVKLAPDSSGPSIGPDRLNISLPSTASDPDWDMRNVSVGEGSKLYMTVGGGDTYVLARNVTIGRDCSVRFVGAIYSNTVVGDGSRVELVWTPGSYADNIRVAPGITPGGGDYWKNITTNGSANHDTEYRATGSETIAV